MSKYRLLLGAAAGLALASAATPSFAASSAVITNGSGIYLGVGQYGELGYTDGVTTTVNGAGGTVGVAIRADLSAFGRGAGLFDATSPGCICEGWGASANGVSGHSDIDSGGVAQNLSLVSFTSTASSATSTTTVNGVDLQVTQEYGASSNSHLMVDHVTLTNTGSGVLNDVRYNRTMDWDVPPTEFNEWVTIGGWPASALLNSGDDGFQVPDPLVASDSINAGCPINSNWEFCGRSDHGARFTFGFGSLAAGESHSFDIFYGGDTSYLGAKGDLAAVGAEVYSLGMSASGNPSGEPLTFAFGFKGVGGHVITVPEPASLGLLATGLAAWFGRRRSAKK